MLARLRATVCAAFFLYDPLYSFYVSNPLEFGELICFALLALDRRQMHATNCCGRVGKKPSDIALRQFIRRYRRLALLTAPSDQNCDAS